MHAPSPPAPAPPVQMVIAIFAAVGLVSALAATVSSVGSGREIGFLRQLVHSEGIWLLFAALSPLVLRTAMKHPLDGAWATRLPAHLLAFAGMSLGHTLVYTTVAGLAGGADLARVWEVIRGTWIGNMRADIFVYAILVGGYYLYAARARPAQVDQPSASPDVPAETPPARLVVKDRGRISFVELHDIEVVEAEGDYVRVRAAGRSHLIRETLRSMEASLGTERFARIHRSTIVNLSRIAELQPHAHGEFVAVMKSGTRVKVSRNYRAAILGAMRPQGRAPMPGSVTPASAL